MATPPDLNKTLSSVYNIHAINIISSTSISTKATTMIKHLTTEPQQDAKSTICKLTARSNVANKLISIVEIAKREILASSSRSDARHDGGSLYQYSALGSEMVTLKPPTTEKKTARQEGLTADGDVEAAVATNNNNDDDEDAFEVMKGPEQKEKIRAVPVLTVYLSRVSVKELKKAYG